MANQNIPENTNGNRNAVNLQNKKAGGNEAQQVGNDLPNRVALPPSVGQRNVVVQTKTMVKITPEGQKIRMWVDADTVTPTEWQMFFAEAPDAHGEGLRVHIDRQAVNPPSLHERQLAHAKKHPNDTTAIRVAGLGSETSEGAVEA